MLFSDQKRYASAVAYEASKFDRPPHDLVRVYESTAENTLMIDRMIGGEFVNGYLYTLWIHAMTKGLEQAKLLYWT